MLVTRAPTTMRMPSTRPISRTVTGARSASSIGRLPEALSMGSDAEERKPGEQDQKEAEAPVDQDRGAQVRFESGDRQPVARDGGEDDADGDRDHPGGKERALDVQDGIAADAGEAEEARGQGAKRDTHPEERIHYRPESSS